MKIILQSNVSLFSPTYEARSCIILKQLSKLCIPCPRAFRFISSYDFAILRWLPCVQQILTLEHLISTLPSHYWSIPLSPGPSGGTGPAFLPEHPASPGSCQVSEDNCILVDILRTDFMYMG